MPLMQKKKWHSKMCR